MSGENFCDHNLEGPCYWYRTAPTTRIIRPQMLTVTRLRSFVPDHCEIIILSLFILHTAYLFK